MSNVQECAGSLCLPATAFSWQSGQSGFAAAENTGQAGGDGSAAPVSADLNGDGRPDLVYARNGEWYVRFAQQGGGFGSEHATGVSVIDASYARAIHFQRYSGQPPDEDVLIVNSVSGSDQWAIMHWDSNTSAFTVTNTGIAVNGEAGVVDVSGNGLDDLLTYDATGSSLLEWTNNDGQFSSSSKTLYTYPVNTSPTGGSKIEIVGFRDDHKALHFDRSGGGGAILRVAQYTRQCVLYSGYCRAWSWVVQGYEDAVFLSFYGNAAPYSLGQPVGTSGGASGGHAVALDANGDGLSDIFDPAGATLYLSTGQGLTAVSYGYSTSGLDLAQAVAADENGDGRDDILVPDSNGDWMLLSSTGTALSAPVDTGVSSSAFGSYPLAVDTEGRRLKDLVGRNSSGDIELALRHGPYPDLLSSVADGLGNTVNLSWVPMSDSSVVHLTDPQQQASRTVHGDAYLLSSVTRNDGIGGTYTLSYSYDAPVNAIGNDYEGFSQVTTTDSRTGDTDTVVYAPTPYTHGIATMYEHKQSNGDLISERSIGYNNTGQPIQQGEPILLTKVVDSSYDQSGNPLTTVTRQYGYDSNNVENDIQVTTLGVASGKSWTKETTLAPVESTSASAWCVGTLDNSVTSTETLPSGGTATQETTYATDASHCRINSETTNANMAQNLQVKRTLQYDGFGNVDQVSVQGYNPDGSAMSPRVTQMGYDSHGEFQTSTTDAAGDAMATGWNEVFGEKSSQSAANGSITDFSYDSFGRLSKTTLPTGAYASVSYQACTSGCSRWAFDIQTTNYDASGKSAGEHWRYIDRYGRTYERASTLQGGNLSISRTLYNAQGQVYEQSAPYLSGASEYWTSYQYDPVGRVTSVTSPTSNGGTVTRNLGYSGLSTTTNNITTGTSRTVVRNAVGETTSVTDALGDTSTYSYNARGLLTSLNAPDSGTTTLTYDQAGDRTQLVGPDRATQKFSYDSLGDLCQQTNARGQTITMDYDALGRMSSRVFPDGSGQTETQNWTYSNSGNAAGELTQESDNVTGFIRTLSYNAYGEPTQVNQTLGGVIKTMQFSYDSLGRRASVTYPVSANGGPLTVDYNYDTDGYLNTVTNAGTGTVYWKAGDGSTSAPMNAFGELEGYTLGGGLDVALTHKLRTGALAGISAGASGGHGVLDATRTYNASGSAASRTDANMGVSEQYSYDSAQRLTQVDRTNSGGNTSITYTYGKTGRFTQGPGGQYSYPSSYGPQHPLHSPSQTSGTLPSAYSYDDDGDRTQSSRNAITWDALGEARSIDSSGSGSIQLTYDPEGDLVNNTHAGGGRYLGKWVKLVDASDWSARIIVQGQVVAVVKDTAGTQSTQYLVQDGLGSTVAVAQGNGTLIGRIAYSPWGRFVDPQNGTAPVSATSVAAQTTVTYTGHELIAGTGLIDMGARIYDPETGLFISPDPTVAHPYDSQDLNQYAYVEDNPMTLIDPKGLTSWTGQCWESQKKVSIFNGPWIPVGKPNTVCNGMGWQAYQTYESSFGQGGVQHNGLPGWVWRNPGRGHGGNASSAEHPGRGGCGNVPQSPPGADIYYNIQLASAVRAMNNVSALGFGHFIDLIDFAYMERGGGTADYKLQGLKYDNFGNFNYGATGAAMGISRDTLLRAAGAYTKYFGTYNPINGNPWGGPPYGDERNDQYQIKNGIKFEHCFYKKYRGN